MNLRVQFDHIPFQEMDTLADMMLRVYIETGTTFIVIIDEYDVLVREQADAKLFTEYLSF